MKRLERLLAIALLLSARRRLVARELASELSVTLRTIYRDVRALVAAGFPIEGVAGDGYRLASTAHLRPLALTPDEADALVLAAYGARASVDSRAREVLVSATTKIEAAMGPDAAARTRHIARKIVFPPTLGARMPNTEMLEAIRERRAARITFAPPDAPRTIRTIEPLGLVSRGDAWWLLAYCRLRRDARAFRLDHIAVWKSLGSFAPRDGFSFDEVVVRDAHLSHRLFGRSARPTTRGS
jgi:predicted DNA-binding transcriptional regulator YafY